MDGLSIALDAIALLLAGWTFARVAAVRWMRGVAASVSLACAVTGPALIAADSAPEWTRIIAVCALFLAFCAVAAVVSPIGGTSDDDESGGLTWDDWDPHSPDTPGGGTDDFQPDWWPEFEREFANYVSQPLPPLRRDSSATPSTHVLP